MMKKLVCLLSLVAFATPVSSQVIDTQQVEKNNLNELLPAWCIDGNFKFGLLDYKMTSVNMARNYLNSTLASIGKLNFSGGKSFGGDFQLGYFFGKKRHFGVGLGFMYFSQTGSLELEKFRVEYQSTDSRADVYRQIITANAPIKEDLEMTNIQIPLVMKYKTMLSKKWGFTVDAGLTYNAQQITKYSTNASFDYEAVYNYRLADGKPIAFYDNATPASAGAWLITKASYTDKNPSGNIPDTFARLRTQGYNVALGSEPTNKSGNVDYASTSIGILISPSASYKLSNNVALNIGVYYMQQMLTNDNATTYQITDKVGSYSSLLNGSNRINTINYGLNVGLRVYLTGAKDRDKDGVVDRRDDCPDMPGVKWFKGCPDRDMDSVMDSDDDCPDVKGLKKYKGCPDTDGDGVLDKNDFCPTVYGLARLRGCPDSDGDGVADKDDACPDQKGTLAMKGCPDTDADGIIDPKDDCPETPGLAQFNGCPDRDNDGTPDSKDKCPEVPGSIDNSGCPVVKNSTLDVDMIRFQTGTSMITKESKRILDDAIEVLKADELAILVIDGHSDSIGPRSFNHRLSKRRAETVKRYLLSRGVKSNRLNAIGHGSDEPLDTNKTREGRARNRRVVMSIKYLDN